MEKNEKKESKWKSFQLIWQYLKEDKIKLFIYVFLTIAMIMPNVLGPWLWGKALEGLIAADAKTFFTVLIIYTGVYILFYTVCMVPHDKLHNILEVKFIKKVSKDMYKKIDDLPARAFEEIGVGEFINRLSSDPDRIIELLSKLIRMTVKACVIVFVFVACLKISWILGLEILIFGLIMGCISMKFFPKIKKSQEKVKEESDKYVKQATENISGIREIKSLGIKKQIEKNISNNLDELYKNSMKIRNDEITYYSLNNLTYFILQFIILGTGGILLLKGQLSYAMFIMIESYIWRIDDVVESISDFGVSFNKVSVSLKRIDEILNNRLYQSEQYGNVTLKEVKGTIEFDRVSFKYTDDEENTLNELSLKIEPHKKIAIVGRSGNGKSTIFNLLLRYFDATDGKVLIDGVDIRELTETSLRNTISIIRQTPFLFNMSIFDNFKMVKEDIILKEIRDVCKKAYIDEYIMSLPNKYDTIIGEGGVNLSGGQKQRLAIARTLLLDTKIILFDEATSALDNESQMYIKKTIDDLVATHTIIIVAHRLSTIIDADVINIIDKGRLSGKGTHKELLKTDKVYKTLYNSESEE